MKTYEFKILVDDRRVTGRYGVHGEEPQPAGSAELDPDPLILETVGLMNRWLSFWDLIENSKIRLKETLLEPGTLDVLGTHLWRLLLTNDVGRELKARIPARGKPPLRLSIEFADKADATLKGLPWEFLYEPERGWYLATKTELLLTRFVTTDSSPATVAQAGERDTLRALLIAALPRVDEFAAYREALGDLRTALNDVPNLLVPEPIQAWDAGEVSAKLEASAYHIVHVVGICKGTPGNPRIYLGGAGDGFRDPAQFIDTLTANPMRPRLVILQLCDFVDGDATENFERLAPALIKRGVPAVLALQYAARPQADTVGLGTNFYRSLVEGQNIGVAVQASRKRLMDSRRDRRFGTPVLYLQEDIPLRRPGSPSGPVTSPAQSAASGAKSVRKALMTVVQRTRDLDEAATSELLLWVSDLDRDAGPDEVMTAIKEKLREPLDRRSVDVYAGMLIALGELGKES